jgi:hypothetical protein
MFRLSFDFSERALFGIAICELDTLNKYCNSRTLRENN